MMGDVSSNINLTRPDKILSCEASLLSALVQASPLYPDVFIVEIFDSMQSNKRRRETGKPRRYKIGLAVCG